MTSSNAKKQRTEQAEGIPGRAAGAPSTPSQQAPIYSATDEYVDPKVLEQTKVLVKTFTKAIKRGDKLNTDADDPGPIVECILHAENTAEWTAACATLNLFKTAAVGAKMRDGCQIFSATQRIAAAICAHLDLHGVRVEYHVSPVAAARINSCDPAQSSASECKLVIAVHGWQHESVIRALLCEVQKKFRGTNMGVALALLKRHAPTIGRVEILLVDQGVEETLLIPRDVLGRQVITAESFLKPLDPLTLDRLQSVLAQCVCAEDKRTGRCQQPTCMLVHIYTPAEVGRKNKRGKNFAIIDDRKRFFTGRDRATLLDLAEAARASAGGDGQEAGGSQQTGEE